MGRIIDHFLFYSPLATGDTLVLGAEETRHARTVLRVNCGDTIFVTDGAGKIYTGVVETIDNQECRATTLRTKEQPAQKPVIHLYIGLPEKDSFESAITGLTALGIVRIVAVECAFCQKRWWTKMWDEQETRFKKKMVAAAKQSWNCRLPDMGKPVCFSEAVAGAQGTVLVADAHGAPCDTITSGQNNRASIFSCFVGPPGGFSPEEECLLTNHGAFRVRLSGHRLRTELAATVFAGILVQMFGEH